MWEPFDCADGFDGAAPVGSFEPNPWGLYDVLGNVWEWVADCVEYEAAGSDEGGEATAAGDNKSNKCAKRVLRGGSWSNGARYLRAPVRDWLAPGNRHANLGLRLARSD